MTSFDRGWKVGQLHEARCLRMSLVSKCTIHQPYSSLQGNPGKLSRQVSLFQYPDTGAQRGCTFRMISRRQQVSEPGNFDS